MSTNDWWARKLGSQNPAPQPVPTSQAWWAPQVRQPAPQQPQPPGGDLVSLQQLNSMDASTMSQEALETLAMAKLQASKYNNNCPHCGSTNLIEGQQTRQGVSASRCFDCGWSSANIHSEYPLQPTSKLGKAKGGVMPTMNNTGGNWNGQAQHISALHTRQPGDGHR
jgi:predicted RNA-binding Zn-ribbon protein involved in translation (DUF1610 family)